jgi:predicted transcriptional regulator
MQKAQADDIDEAAAELSRLDTEEREISAQRQELHERIDAIYLSAPLSDADASLLDELEELELRTSERRRRLHLKIDELRAQVGLPPWREAEELTDAA